MAAMDGNNPRQVDDDQEIDLTDLLNVLIQGWKWIVAIFVVVVGLGVSYAVLTPPIYEADVLIQVEELGADVGLAGLSMLLDIFRVQQGIVGCDVSFIW